MPDPRRLESPLTPEAADRDSHAEALLVEGLDRYFAGRYEDAIHLWTRVLFLDRSHARARAYIDRARTALAERQRRADEMLHATDELLAHGQTDEARALLSQAVATSGDDERAAEIRSRLERVERARATVAGPTPPAALAAAPVRSWPRQHATFIGGATVFVALLITLIASATAREFLGMSATPTALPVVGRSSLLPVLSSSETALVRARTLYSRGRLAEALQVLDRVDPESANRPAADRLRVEIQQLLLATRRGVSPTIGDVARGRP